MRIIRDSGPLKKTKVIQLIGLRPSTVPRLIDELMSEGWLVVKQKRVRKTGRPGEFLRIEAKKRLIFSLYITKNSIVVTDALGVFSSRRFQTLI